MCLYLLAGSQYLSKYLLLMYPIDVVLDKVVVEYTMVCIAL